MVTPCKDRIELRSLCRLFRDALKPLPRWTTFPHSNYPTLNSLMDRLNEMFAALPAVVWEVCPAAGTLALGMEVRAKFVDWRGGTSIKDATIQKVNGDDTFDLASGDVYSEPRKNVPLNEIQIQNVSGGFSYFILFCSFCSLFPYALLFCSHFFFSSVLYFLLFSLFFFLLSFHVIINRRKVSWQERKRTKKRLSNLFC